MLWALARRWPWACGHHAQMSRKVATRAAHPIQRGTIKTEVAWPSWLLPPGGGTLAEARVAVPAPLTDLPRCVRILLRTSLNSPLPPFPPPLPPGLPRFAFDLLQFHYFFADLLRLPPPSNLTPLFASVNRAILLGVLPGRRDRQLRLLRGLTSPASASCRCIDLAPAPPVAFSPPARHGITRPDPRAPPPAAVCFLAQRPSHSRFTLHHHATMYIPSRHHHTPPALSSLLYVNE